MRSVMGRVCCTCRRADEPDDVEDRAQRRRRRIRIGPLAVDGSTICDRCTISTEPSATRRRAAARAGSIRSRHSSPVAPFRPATRRAASHGQMVAVRARWSRSSRIAASSASSSGRRPRRRHVDEQYFTASQSRSHFLRHVIVRPHATHDLAAGAAGMTPVFPIGRRVEPLEAAVARGPAGRRSSVTA